MNRLLGRYHTYVSAAAVLVTTGLPLDATAQIALSEIRTDQPGADTDEYFELTGPPGIGLTPYSYVVIGDGAGGSGVVETVIDLTELSVPADGYLLVAEPSFTLPYTPDHTTSMNFENNDNVTHLLVSDFTGAPGDDLDTNDDGLLDFAPWSHIQDCVSIRAAVDTGDLTYCGVSTGPDGGSAPMHIYYDGGWQIGPRDPGAGIDTPGSPPASLPIRISGARAFVRGSTVVLQWRAEPDQGVTEFRIYRTEASREIIATVESGEQDYRVSVEDLPPGPHRFEIHAILGGAADETIAELDVLIPPTAPVHVDGPFPNPANRQIHLSVVPQTEGHVSVGLYDVAGRSILPMHEAHVDSGQRLSVEADVSCLAGGVYFVVVRHNGSAAIRPLLVR